MEERINELEERILAQESIISALQGQIFNLEKKVDGLLSGELSTSFEIDLVSTAKSISEDIDRRNARKFNSYR